MEFGGNVGKLIPSGLFWMGVVASAASIISGCSTGAYGRLDRDAEVTALFESYRMPGNYRYFFAGPEGRPKAILGLRNEYELVSTQWTEFDATGPKLKKWVDWLDQTYGMRTQHYPSGFRVKGPSGKDIGIWYSIWDWTVVMLGEDNRVKIYPPEEKETFSAPGDVRQLFRD